MAFRQNSFMCAGLYMLLFTLQSWAKVEVHMKERVEVYVGGTAEIPCNYSSPEDTSGAVIQWFVKVASSNSTRQRIFYLDGGSNVMDQGTGLTDRIAVSRGPERRDLLLVIQNVELGDELEFICQVNGMAAGNEEGHTQLKVFNSPEVPTIEGVHSGISVRNELPSKIATCEAKNGYPKPNITWYRDQTTLQDNDEGVRVQTLDTKESSGLFSVKSELHKKVVKEDKDALFYCEVNYFVPGGTKMSESERINVSVHYPATHVNINVTSPEGLVKEGDDVELRCHADGNPPPPFTFKYKGEELSAELNQLVLHKVTRSNSGKYLCSILDVDTFEEVEGETDLVVNFMDEAVLIPEDPLVLFQGETLTATCNALSSLKTHTVWLKDGQEFSEGHELVMEDVSFDTAGLYSCEVIVPAQPGLQTSASLQLYVQGPPEFSELVSTALEERVGKSLNLSCKARGYPIPVISWASSDTQGLKVVADVSTETEVISVVTLKVTSDVTAYCNATNQYGSDSLSFSIKAIPLVIDNGNVSVSVTVKETPPERVKKEGNGVVIAVIIVCILLLAVLGSVLYFLYKKGKIPCGRSGKQDLTKEKNSKDNIVVEMKSEKSEEAVLLQGVNGDKKSPTDQGETYMDVQM